MISQVGMRREGFTLIEILIATMVLSMGVLGFFVMTTGTIRGHTFNSNQTTATTLARDRLEQIKNANYDNIIPANYPVEHYGNMAGYEPFRRTVTIATDTPGPGTKTITVTVSWQRTAGITHDVTLSTIITP